jgi:hypothetical protein
MAVLDLGSRTRAPTRLPGSPTPRLPSGADHAPTVKVRERLTAENRWADCGEEILAMAERRNEATDESLLMWAGYLVALGRR